MSPLRAGLSLALLLSIVWGVPWLSDVVRRRSRLTYFSRRLRTGAVADPAGTTAARLQAWATLGAALVALLYVAFGVIAGLDISAPLRFAIAGAVLLAVRSVGAWRPFGLSLGLLRYDDELPMFKLASIWSGNGPLNWRMLSAWWFGLALRCMGSA